MAIDLDNAKPMQWCSSFHIQWCEPNAAWPQGGWSLYQISGDNIAKRIVYDADGKLIRRDSWSGYLGMVTTLDELRDAIASVQNCEWEIRGNTAWHKNK